MTAAVILAVLLAANLVRLWIKAAIAPDGDEGG